VCACELIINKLKIKKTINHHLAMKPQMKQVMHPGKYSMIELCSHTLIDANLSQVEGSQGTEEILFLMEEKKNLINSREQEIGAVMK
jgi:hypothetical protein